MINPFHSQMIKDTISGILLQDPVFRIKINRWDPEKV